MPSGSAAFIDRRIQPLVDTPDSRGQLRSDLQTARFFVMTCGAGSSPPVVSTAVARMFEEKSAGLPNEVRYGYSSTEHRTRRLAVVHWLDELAVRQRYQPVDKGSEDSYRIRFISEKSRFFSSFQ
jgi:hypothetical protein